MTENQFSNSLLRKLKRKGIDCTRIESHGTGNGIPDLFIQGNGWDCWLELKCDDKQNIYQPSFNVAWRPGQQAWMMNYYIHHENKKCCYTLMHVTGGMVLIPHTKIYKNNKAALIDVTVINDDRTVPRLSSSPSSLIYGLLEVIK